MEKLEYKKTFTRQQRAKIQTCLDQIKDGRSMSLEKLTKMLWRLRHAEDSTVSGRVTELADFFERQYDNQLSCVFQMVQAALLLADVVDPETVDVEDKRECGFLDGQLTFYKDALRIINDVERDARGK